MNDLHEKIRRHADYLDHKARKLREKIIGLDGHDRSYISGMATAMTLAEEARDLRTILGGCVVA